MTVFRSEGADNVTWLWTLQADEPGTGPDLRLVAGRERTSPGSASTATTASRPTPSTSVFATTINQVRTFTDKPILLSETAVGRSADQFANILNLFNGMAQYRTLGLVWFDKDQSGLDHSPGHTARRTGASRTTRWPSERSVWVYPD